MSDLEPVDSTEHEDPADTIRAVMEQAGLETEEQFEMEAPEAPEEKEEISDTENDAEDHGSAPDENPEGESERAVTYDPPESMTQDERAWFSDQHPEVQERINGYVERRESQLMSHLNTVRAQFERQYQQASDDIARQYQHLGEYANAITPERVQEWKRNGTNLDQQLSVAAFVEDDPQAAIKWISDRHGVHLGELAQLYEDEDPRVAELSRTVRELQGRLDGDSTAGDAAQPAQPTAPEIPAGVQDALQYVQTATDEQNNPLYGYINYVINDLPKYVAATVQANPGMDERSVMHNAYIAACQDNPIIMAHVQQVHGQQAQPPSNGTAQPAQNGTASLSKNDRERIERAKKAASSLSSRSSSTKKNTVPDYENPEDTIRAVMRGEITRESLRA